MAGRAKAAVVRGHSNLVSAFIYVLVISLLASATLRADPDQLHQIMDDAHSFVPQIVLTINHYAEFMLALAAVSVGGIFAISKGRVSLKGGIIYFLIGLSAYETLRLAFSDVSLAAKSLLLFVELMMVLYTFKLAVSLSSASLVATDTLNALLIFCGFLVFFNLYLLRTGGLVNSYVDRFYGDTMHPNFLGVQAALCGSVAFSSLNKRHHIKSAVSLIIILCSIQLLIVTGSRTGSILFSGSIAITWFSAKRRSSGVVIIAGVAVALIALFVFRHGLGSAAAAFDRGGINTRAETTRDLLARVASNPVFGSGDLGGLTENSYLRGWAIYGFAFPIIYGFLIYRLVRRVQLIFKLKTARAISSPYIGIVFGLLMSSLLEGTLTDTFTFGISIFGISIAVLDNLYDEMVVPKMRGKSSPKVGAIPTRHLRPTPPPRIV